MIGHTEVDEQGTKHWYKNGKLHREDGPAVEYSNGSKIWYLNGEYQRSRVKAFPRNSAIRKSFMGHLDRFLDGK